MMLGNKFKHRNVRITSIAHCVVISMSFILSSCIGNNEVQVKTRKMGKSNSPTTSLPAVTVSNIQVVNHQIIITGTNLASISQFSIKEGSTNTNLQIESKSSTTIIANTLSNVTFAAGKILDFIFTNAEAASTFTVNFSLCDSTLGGKGFNCLITPNDKEVLSYDAATGKWKPRAVNGLSYQGAWDANDPQPASTTAGDYFIVSVANGPYSVGDWIVFNGTGFDHINNSSAITSVFGRTGVITATEGDYNLDKMSDVDLLTAPPLTGDVLKYNGTRWVPGTVSAGSGGTVTNVTGSGPISVTSGASTPAISISQATTTTSGYLSNTDWNTFNNKQPSIAAGTTAQYYRGDKTWQTLDTSVVPENVNLYFTNARALGVPLTGFTATNSVIAATDTVLQALGKAQGQIDNLTAGGSNYIVKNGNDTVTGVVNFNTVGALSIGYTPTNLTDATSKSYVDTQRDSRVAKAGDTMSGDLQLNTNLKFKDSGSNTATIQAPTTITTSYVLKLPPALGTNNQVLTTDAAGNLSWTTPAGGGAPSGSAGGDLGGTYPNPTISGLAATKVGGGSVDNTEFGYLDGVTSSIQTQLNAKLSSFTETDPTVSAFAKAALPTCNAGEVLKSNGTTLSCVTDNSGAGSYSGGNNFVVVTNGSGALSDSTVTTTELGYLSGVTSNIQTQLGTKQATISKTTVQDVSKLRIYGANATNYVEISAAALSGNRSLIFPDSNGLSGHVLSTDGAGILSWVAIPSAPVSTVHGRTGAVVSANNDYTASQIANVAAGNIAATNVQTALNELDTEKQNISTFAADVRGVVLTGLSIATNAAIAATDSILVAFGKLQAQITGQATDISNKADRTNITQTITAATVTGLSAPLVGADATNKTYVDAQVAGANNQWTLNSGNVYRSTGNVGIGTSSPEAKLHISSTSADSFLAISSFGGAGGPDAEVFSKASRGTEGTPTAVQANDTLLAVGATAHDGTAYSSTNMAWIEMYASQNWAVGSNGTSIDFATTPNNSITPAVRMKIADDGKVGIGTTTPSGALHVNVNTSGDTRNYSYFSAGNNSGRIIVYGQDSAVRANQMWLDATTAANSLVLSTVNQERMTILPSGYIGVGTTTPTANLHVNGTTRIVDGNQAAGRVLASDANGNASWKQSIIHGNVAPVGNSSTANGMRVTSGVSITLPPGRWQIMGMGITTPGSCRADFGIRNSANDALVKYTLFPPATGDFQTATVTGYVDIAATTTYDLYISARAGCTAQIHSDGNLWDITATGVAY